jgi:hypothetical protein
MMNYLFLGLFVLLSLIPLGAQTDSWQPSPGHTQLPIWPGVPPDAQSVPGPEFSTTKGNKPVAPSCFFKMQ